MIGGFLFLFACGFLMTAIPKFTGSASATEKEILITTVLSSLMLVAGFSGQIKTFRFILIINILSLVFFGLRRFNKRQLDLPNSFIFIPIGIASGLFGTVIILLSELSLLTGASSIFGQLLYYQGFMLSLIIGVGSKLIPVLAGWDEMFMPGSHKKSFQRLSLVAVALIISFLIEAFIDARLGRFLRALAVIPVAIYDWKILRVPLARTWLAFWIWIASWCVPLGLLGAAVFPDYYIHFMHLLFIGGFSLMTMMIASRVTLAHGGHDLKLEKKSKALLIGASLVALATLTRVAAGFLPSTYNSHIFYAAIAWLIGFSIWGIIFVRKMIYLRSGSSHDDNC